MHGTTHERAKAVQEAPPRALISRSVIELILSGLRLESAAGQSALARAGICADKLDRDGVVADRQFIRLLNTLRRTRRDEFWGLLKRPVVPGTFRTMCRLMLQERTLGDAIRAGASFYRLVTPDFAVRVIVSGPVTQIRVVVSGLGEARERAVSATVLFCVYNLINWLIGRRTDLREVNLSYGLWPNTRHPSRSYHAPIRLNAAHTELCLDTAQLSLPVIPDLETSGKFIRMLTEILVLGYRDEGSVTEKVMAILRREAIERNRVDDVAARLAMSPATFRRRLKDEGRANFQDLKDRVRRETACRMLKQTELPLDSIAEQLGFAEASSFHRAFRRWTGKAPGEFRAG